MSAGRLPQPLLEHWEWQDEAACSGMDTARFFAPATERGPRRDAREDAAKQVCAACPVVEQCLRHAMTVGEPFGVWGGTTPAERDALRRAAPRIRLRDTA